MFSIDNLHVHYGLSHVIQGISIDAKPGEVVGIFGRNGVGKTTLMKAIAGWLMPSAGGITLDGKHLDGLAPDHVCRHGVGFVPVTVAAESKPPSVGSVIEIDLGKGVRLRVDAGVDEDALSRVLRALRR